MSQTQNYQVNWNHIHFINSSHNTLQKGYNYTSGWIDSQGKFEYTYGRWEIFAQLPKGKGMWPAHWMDSATVCWPLGAEFDIMENLGDDTSTVYGTLHYGSGCGSSYDQSMQGIFTDQGIDLSAAFHIYALEWNNTHLVW